MELIRGRTPRPQKVMLYASHGEGKSTWASQAPGAGFVQTEDGLSFIDCVKTPLCKSMADVLEGIEIFNQDSDTRWIVIDSIDWAQNLVWQDLVKRHNWESIETPGYGKGFTLALEEMQKLLTVLDGSIACGKNIILIGHAHVRAVNNPGEESYDRWEPKLHKLVNPVVQEWCDHVLFATRKTMVKKEDQGFGKSRKIATGSSETVLKCTPKPTHEAKNRAGLPDELPFSFAAFRDALASKLQKEGK